MGKNQFKSIVESIKIIPDVAKKEGWVLTLDKDEGALFYSPEVIPNKTDLFQITDEYAIYVDKNYKPKGVMIESYGVNFIEHHPEFKKLSEEVFYDDNKTIEKINPTTAKKDKKEDAKLLQSLLEKTLIVESIQRPLSAS